jgi:NTE family protein
MFRYLRTCPIGRKAQWASLIALSVLMAGCSTAPVSSTTTELPLPAVLLPADPAPVVKKPPRIGLALGGGAARGFAHVGVIQVLEEAGIRPNLVA